jgi:protein-glutamine gamma-glutamyltransferase
MATLAAAQARPASATAPLASPGALRLAAFAALALFGAAHWGALVAPGAGGAMTGMVAAGAAAGAVLLGVSRGLRADVRTARGVARLVLLGAVVLGLLALVFLAAGVPAGLVVDPRDWDVLVSGLADGISSTPGITVPYRGADEWTRTAVLIGGTALVALAAGLAFWPRRGRSLGLHKTAAVALGALYAVPVVQHGPDSPYLDGVVFCVLLAGFLWLETLRADRLLAAGACLLVATVLGAVVAPRLDAGAPWLDYESLAERLEPTKALAFSWDHGYGPLRWPRDGREILRVRARSAAYWKADDLDAFDGVRWLDSGSVDPAQPDERPGPASWTQTITVVDRGLLSQSFVGAGTTLGIDKGPHHVETAPGHFEVLGGPLRPGSSYQARVYTPRPTDAQLRRAPPPGSKGPGSRYANVTLPVRDGVTVTDPGSGVVLAARRAVVSFPRFGTDASPQVLWRGGIPLRPRDRDAVLRNTPYAPMLALARRLRADSISPYDFVQRVRARVMEGALYDENVSGAGLPLERFLFDDRRGYCQHFSGAMALLLRMGGIPARVATGFSPGVFNTRRKEFSVKDTDAHSWVEAWFEGLGWVTFDPTPSASPARSQQDDRSSGASSFGPGPPVRGSNVPGDRPFEQGDLGATRAPATDEGFDWRVPLVGALLAVLLGVVVVRVTRAGRLPGPPLAPELAELQRALHRSGRTPAHGTTLTRLEALLGGPRDGGAGAYLRSLRRQRFEGDGAPGPTSAERRALRRRLGEGLGPRGRLRAWWALPPRVRPRRR